MGAIALNAALCLMLLASPRDEIRDALASVATDLSASNVAGAISAMSKDLPEREELREQLDGLTAAFDLTSSVEIVASTGDDKRQTARVDWYLAGRSRTDNAVQWQRREWIDVTFVKEGKRWKIAQISPRTLFEAAR